MIRRHRWWLVAIGIVVAAGAWYLIARPRWRQLDGQHHVVGFSAEGSVLATIGEDGIGHLWDPATGELRDDLAGTVTGMSFPFSTDGRYHVALLPADGDKPFHGSATVIETKSKGQIFKFHYDPRMTLQQRKLGFASNGKFFFSMGALVDHTSSLWSLPDGKKVLTDSKPLIAISNNGEKVARYYDEVTEGKRRGILEVVRVEDGDTELILEPWDWPLGIAFSSDDSQLVTIFGGGVSGLKMFLHDLKKNESAIVEGKPYYHMFGPFALSFIHDDQLIEVTGFDTAQHPAVAVCTAATQDFRLVWNARCISSNKKWCFREEFGNKRQTVLQVFEISPQIAEDSNGNRPPATYDFTCESLFYPHQAAISDDGRIGVIFSERDGVLVVDMIDKTVVLKTTLPASNGSQIYLSPNGRHVAGTVQTSEGPKIPLMALPRH